MPGPFPTTPEAYVPADDWGTRNLNPKGRKFLELAPELQVDDTELGVPRGPLVTPPDVRKRELEAIEKYPEIYNVDKAAYIPEGFTLEPPTTSRIPTLREWADEVEEEERLRLKERNTPIPGLEDGEPEDTPEGNKLVDLDQSLPPDSGRVREFSRPVVRQGEMMKLGGPKPPEGFQLEVPYQDYGEDPTNASQMVFSPKPPQGFILEPSEGVEIIKSPYETVRDSIKEAVDLYGKVQEKFGTGVAASGPAYAVYQIGKEFLTTLYKSMEQLGSEGYQPGVNDETSIRNSFEAAGAFASGGFARGAMAKSGTNELGMFGGKMSTELGREIAALKNLETKELLPMLDLRLKSGKDALGDFMGTLTGKDNNLDIRANAYVLMRTYKEAQKLAKSLSQAGELDGPHIRRALDYELERIANLEDKIAEQRGIPFMTRDQPQLTKQEMLESPMEERMLGASGTSAKGANDNFKPPANDNMPGGVPKWVKDTPEGQIPMSPYAEALLRQSWKQFGELQTKVTANDRKAAAEAREMLPSMTKEQIIKTLDISKAEFDAAPKGEYKALLADLISDYRKRLQQLNQDQQPKTESLDMIPQKPQEPQGRPVGGPGTKVLTDYMENRVIELHRAGKNNLEIQEIINAERTGANPVSYGVIQKRVAKYKLLQENIGGALFGERRQLSQSERSAGLEVSRGKNELPGAQLEKMMTDPTKWRDLKEMINRGGISDKQLTRMFRQNQMFKYYIEKGRAAKE